MNYLYRAFSTVPYIDFAAIPGSDISSHGADSSDGNPGLLKLKQSDRALLDDRDWEIEHITTEPQRLDSLSFPEDPDYSRELNGDEWGPAYKTGNRFVILSSSSRDKGRTYPLRKIKPEAPEYPLLSSWLQHCSSKHATCKSEFSLSPFAR